MQRKAQGRALALISTSNPEKTLNTERLFCHLHANSRLTCSGKTSHRRPKTVMTWEDGIALAGDAEGLAA
jgi:hypothetical protein